MGHGQPCAAGGGATGEGAGREVSWRISKRSVDGRGEHPRSYPRDSVHRSPASVSPAQTEHFRMDMKKRISLELRNRSPAEVSRFPYNNTGTGAWNSPGGEAAAPRRLMEFTYREHRVCVLTFGPLQFVSIRL